jgi:hemerythrin-like domain-containing protein
MAEDTPSRFFVADHRECDARWAEVEAAADAGDHEAAVKRFEAFDAAMRRHFEMEENVLFPAVEAALDMRGMGPTQIMRAEHAQMRGVLDQMAAEASAHDVPALVDLGDTLLMLIQQHNVKEEGVLYPMCDQALPDEWPRLKSRLA